MNSGRSSATIITSFDTSLYSEMISLRFDAENQKCDEQKFFQIRAAALSLFNYAFGQEHHFTKDFERAVRGPFLSEIKAEIGLLEGAMNAISQGWVGSIRAIVSGEIFTDFLEMADYLLSEDYKDAAAVMGGSVLEQHLRVLCKNRNISHFDRYNHTKKTSVMNDDLYKEKAYESGDHKQISAWLDVRNNAAHGHYGKYQKPRVEQMVAGIRDFIVRVAN
jgi:hypothetical protein